MEILIVVMVTGCMLATAAYMYWRSMDRTVDAEKAYKAYLQERDKEFEEVKKKIVSAKTTEQLIKHHRHVMAWHSRYGYNHKERARVQELQKLYVDRRNELAQFQYSDYMK